MLPHQPPNSQIPSNTTTPIITTSPTSSTSDSSTTRYTLPPQPPNPQIPSKTNNHTMTTRSKAGIFKPKAFTASTEPKSVKVALSDPKWKHAMIEEYQALMRNKTWDLVPLPAGKQPIGSKWVFRMKYNADGSLNRHKARLVEKGFHQVPGFDFSETFSPVVKPITIRVVLSHALTCGWPIRQLDINNAFLNGIIHEEVFMQQPEGFQQGGSHIVCKLNKSLYGLRQAPHAWFDKLTSC